MEPAATTTERAAEAYPIEKVRAAFPALAREVHGQPVAYLDSGARAQRVLASIQAVDRYGRRHHANVHRGSHTLSAEATAAYEGARATVADGVNRLSGPDMGVLIITHYQRILHYVKPDFVNVMFEGRIVKQGGPELVGVLEEKGYGWIREEVEAGATA
jgi:hypothetical protein